ncbi:hypothetical protein F0562_024605 [Nyssa sinensis]|uniref:Pectate lyase superfamily protein domain-containing protein n=1 Tax=Nyssa sinensis TaxID=561372 RepID=A0A5J5BD75_9ASTE|nr:hypothetical protein F0562_024605 [Nyssa sinensis]
MRKLRSSPVFSHLTCIISICMVYYMILISNLTIVQGFDSLIQLPQSSASRDRPRSKRVILLSDYGAKGDGLSDATKAFNDSWKVACSCSSRSKIVIPAGNTYLVKPIDFAGPCRSKVTLRISGTIVAPKDPAVWHGLNPRKWLYFHGVNHLTVEGKGIVNGMGQEWWARSCKINATNPCRHAPTALTFHRCKNLKVRNLMMVNSQQMHMAFTHCVRVAASRLKVLAPAVSPNTDGIHISASSHIEVKDSIIGTGLVVFYGCQTYSAAPNLSVNEDAYVKFIYFFFFFNCYFIRELLREFDIYYWLIL